MTPQGSVSSGFEEIFEFRSGSSGPSNLGTSSVFMNFSLLEVVSIKIISVKQNQLLIYR